MSRSALRYASRALYRLLTLTKLHPLPDGRALQAGGNRSRELRIFLGGKSQTDRPGRQGLHSGSTKTSCPHAAPEPPSTRLYAVGGKTVVLLSPVFSTTSLSVSDSASVAESLQYSAGAYHGLHMVLIPVHFSPPFIPCHRNKQDPHTHPWRLIRNHCGYNHITIPHHGTMNQKFLYSGPIELPFFGGEIIGKVLAPSEKGRK